MKFLKAGAVATSLATFVVLAACSSSSTTASNNAGTDGGGAAALTFTEIYTNIISSKCAPCHTTANGEGITSGKLDMTTQANAYSNLVGVAAAGAACSGKGTRVVAKMPDSSIFYLKISDDDPTPCGGKMPLGEAPLSDDESDGIEAWINAGALNN